MEIDEQSKKLKLWVRRKKTGLKLICSRCGQHVPAARIHEVCEREVRDLPCFEYMTTVVVETYRLKCPRCGIRAERVPQLPSKAPYSKRFEEAVGQACESAAARQVARQWLAESTVRAIDLRYLERWDAKRRKPPLRQMGVDEIYRGKKDKFLTVVCNLESGGAIVVRQGAEEGDVGRILSQAVEEPAAETDRGGLRGHVGAVPAQHGGVGSRMPHRL